MNNGCTDYKPLRKLRRGEGPRCGTCRLWMANLKSRTNARPLLRGEHPCPGDGNWEQPDLNVEPEVEALLPCGGDAWEAAGDDATRGCDTCGKSVTNGGKCGPVEVRDGE